MQVSFLQGLTPPRQPGLLFFSMIRSKAKTAVLAAEGSEVTEQRRQEGAKRRRSESPVFSPSHLRSSLCSSGTSVASFLGFLPGRWSLAVFYGQMYHPGLLCDQRCIERRIPARRIAAGRGLETTEGRNHGDALPRQLRLFRLRSRAMASADVAGHSDRAEVRQPPPVSRPVARRLRHPLPQLPLQLLIQLAPHPGVRCRIFDLRPSQCGLGPV